MSNQGFNEGPLTYLAAAQIAANLLVTLTATAGSVGLCGASGFPVGVSTDLIANAAYGAFQPMKGRILVTASASITAGNFVKAAANGQVAPEASAATRTAFTIGQAETGASQNGTFWMVCLG